VTRKHTVKRGLRIGALAPQFREQFTDAERDLLGRKNIDIAQDDANAVTRLRLRGLIPDAVARRANQRIVDRLFKKKEES